MNVAIGASFVGDVMSGNAKKQKAKSVARRLKELRTRDQNEMIRLRDADQAEALALARADEARMAEAHKKAIGYDLVRLREDAAAAGFNPLTVLAATGGANYGNTAAPIVSSPFVSRPFMSRVDAVLPAQMAKIDTAGYFGDAVSRAGSAYLGVTQERARLAADKDMADAIRNPNPPRGNSVPMQGARVVDARPASNVSGLPGFATDFMKWVMTPWRDRETEVVPNRNEPAFTDVSTPSGDQTRVINNNVFESEIVTTISDLWGLSSLVFQKLTPDETAFERMQREYRANPTPERNWGDTFRWLFTEPKGYR